PHEQEHVRGHVEAVDDDDPWRRVDIHRTGERAYPEETEDRAQKHVEISDRRIEQEDVTGHERDLRDDYGQEWRDAEPSPVRRQPVRPPGEDGPEGHRDDP